MVRGRGQRQQGQRSSEVWIWLVRYYRAPMWSPKFHAEFMKSRLGWTRIGIGAVSHSVEAAVMQTQRAGVSSPPTRQQARAGTRLDVAILSAASLSAVRAGIHVTAPTVLPSDVAS